MKKLFTVSAIICIFLVLLCINAGAKEFITNNPGFEEDFSGWTTSTSYTDTYKFEVVDGGNPGKALKISGGLDGTYAGNVNYKQRIYGISGGDNLTFSYDAKAESLSRTAMIHTTLTFYNSSGGYINAQRYNYYGVIPEWRTLTFDLIAPADAASVAVAVRLQAQGVIYYDNVSLTNDNNKTTLDIYSGGVKLNSLPAGVKNLNAKLRYVDDKQGQVKLIVAAYESKNNTNRLCSIGVTSVDTTNGSVVSSFDIPISESTEGMKIAAFVWEPNSFLKPLTEKTLLSSNNENALSPAYDFMFTEKMRGAYGGFISLFNGHIDEMIDRGSNTLILAIQDAPGQPTLESPTTIDSAMKVYLDKIDEYVKENPGLKVFVKENYSFNPFYTNRDNKYEQGWDLGVDNNNDGIIDGTGRNQPCPVNRENWEAMMLPRLSIAAAHPSVAGVAIDLEMYTGYSNNTGASCSGFPNPCYCENCLVNFAIDSNLPKAYDFIGVPANERQAFAKDNDLYEPLVAWQEAEIAEILTDIRKQLHKINPDLIMGIVLQVEQIKGVEKGLGTEQMPVLIFNEHTYGGGFSTLYTQDIKIKEKNLNAINIPGFWTNKDYMQGSRQISVPPSQLADKIITSANDYPGYWLYSIDYVLGNLATPYTEDVIEEYKNALLTAHEYLDQNY